MTLGRIYEGWLDRWDERRASVGAQDKIASPMQLQAELAFEGGSTSSSFEDFCALAERACLDPEFFREDVDASRCWEVQPDCIQFPSALLTDVANNNFVRAHITTGRDRKRALVIFHHWNARSRQSSLARILALFGITVFEIEMPYHFSRSRSESRYADYMLSPNLGRTVQAVRLAVMDGKRLIRFLKADGYESISVLGLSLGSWVAGLVAAHDPAVSRAALFLTAGSLADMVWTGTATQHIRTSLEMNIDLPDLERAWRPLSLGQYSSKLARKDLGIQVVLAQRDKVVPPQISEKLVKQLEAAGCTPNIIRLNCGHYSLGLPPYNFNVAWRLVRS